MNTKQHSYVNKPAIVQSMETLTRPQPAPAFEDRDKFFSGCLLALAIEAGGLVVLGLAYWFFTRPVVP